MSSFSWLRSYPHRLFCRRSRQVSPSRKRVSPQRRVRPCLEALEDRAVPAVFNVGAGDTATLIADMQTANANGDPSNVINLTNSNYIIKSANNNDYGPNGLPAVENNLTIHGNGATIERFVQAGFLTPDFRLFYVPGGGLFGSGSLTIDNVTLENGLAKGGDSNQGGGGLGAGGAIFNQGTLNLADVTFVDNEALGGSSNVVSAGNGGGGMGQSSPAANSDGGGFGGSGFSTAGGAGKGNLGGGGGGDGFLGANSSGGDASDVLAGDGGGKGGFGGGGTGDGGIGGVGGGSSSASDSGDGGFTGKGGLSSGLAGGDTSGGGGGGIGGGGGAGADGGGSGGFGGGGGFGFDIGGAGGFGAGAGGKGLIGGTDAFGGLFGGNSSGAFGGGGAGIGGAIFNMGADSAHPGSGTVTCVNCTFTENSAQGGSAASQGNGGYGVAGAIFNLDGHVTLTNDTLVGNSARPAATGGGNAGLAGAIFNAADGNDIDTGNPVTAALVLNNCIVALNTSGNNFDLFSVAYKGSGTNTATVSGSHNLIGQVNGIVPSSLIVSTADPKLGPLQNNGGLTPTMLPQSGSPALGAGDASLAPATDQRGQPRSPKAPSDLGAVQVSVPPTNGGGSGSTSNSTPPTLHKPPLLAFIDAILGGIETINNNHTETVTDSIFGFPLIVSTYDGAGNLTLVTYFGINITFLFA
jgi:hypothetical protein